MRAPSYQIAVAHFGHPSDRIKHWALVVILTQLNRDAEDSLPPPTAINAIAYQIQGDQSNYTLAPPQSVELFSQNAYLGRVPIGWLDATLLPQFSQRVGASATVDEHYGGGHRGGRIVLDDPNWNSQNWVVDTIERLYSEGYGVRSYSKETLSSMLEKAQR